jgi:pimeloyl-ACP methyl ester carboxylesterase
LKSFSIFAIDFPVDGSVLPGELIVPDVQRGSVIFAPSGGLADRDGNDEDVGFSPLLQVAEGLADLGVTSLRFEGRGIASPQTTLEDFLAVIEQAVHLPEIGEAPCLLGHNVGCTLALVAANRLADLVVKLVLIAPPISPLNELLAYRAQAAELLRMSLPETHMQVLEALQTAYAQRKSFLPGGFAISCPALIIQGTMDWVFPPAESQRLVEQLADKGTRLLLDGLDHWLVASTTWRSTNENLSSDRIVSPTAIAQIAEWIALS